MPRWEVSVGLGQMLSKHAKLQQKKLGDLLDGFEMFRMLTNVDNLELDALLHRRNFFAPVRRGLAFQVDPLWISIASDQLRRFDIVRRCRTNSRKVESLIFLRS